MNVRNRRTTVQYGDTSIDLAEISHLHFSRSYGRLDGAVIYYRSGACVRIDEQTAARLEFDWRRYLETGKVR